MPTQPLAWADDLPREFPLVGRRDELERMYRLFGHETRVDPVLLLTGDPGVGKSRLARALSEEATRRGWTVATGRGYPVEHGMPYSLISDAFLPILKTFDEAALTVHTRGTSGDIHQLFPMLGSFEEPRAEGWAPGESRARLFWSFTEFVKRLSERAPLLIVAEDLHWADQSSLSLLHFVVRQLQGESIRVLATASRGYGQGLEELDRFERSLGSLNILAKHELSPLSLRATESLLQELFQVGGSPLTDFAAHLYEWTRGNPHFLEESLKELIQAGRLYRRDGTWLGWDVEHVDLPGSVRDALLMRLRRLSKHARSLADLVAVSGGRAPLRVLERVADMDPSSAAEAISELTTHSLADESEQDGEIEVGLRHPMVRETLYQDLGPSRRRLLHRSLAEGLEQAYPGASAPVDQLAYHFQRGGGSDADPRALRYLADAGRSALRRHADREAVAYLRAAVRSCPDDTESQIDPSRVELLEQLARGLARLGQHDEATTIWTELLDGARERRDRRSTGLYLRHLGLVAFWSGRHEASLRFHDQALDELEGLDEKAMESRVLLARGVALQELGRPDEARSCIQGSLERARALDDPMLLGRAHRALALLSTWIGEADEARRHGWQAVELADRANDPYVRFWGRWALASLEGLTGHTGEMRGLMAQAGQIAEELRSPVLKLWTAELEIEFAYGTGDWDAALAQGERAISLATSLSQTSLLARLLVWTATVYLGRGDTARARELADRAWHLAGLDGDDQGRGDLHVIVPAHIGRTACLIAEERWNEAVEVGEAGVELAGRAGYVFWSLHVLLPLLAEAHLRSRDLERAGMIAIRMREDGVRIGHRLATAWADGCDGLIRWLAGDVETSIDKLRAGAEALEAIPWVYDAARIRRQLAGRLAELGRREEALSELRRVHDTFARLGAQRELEATRRMFLEISARPPVPVQLETRGLLTAREWDVADCTARDMTAKAIAKELGIRPRTVTTHLTNIYRKLEIEGRDALRSMVREGRIPMPDSEDTV